MKFKLKYLIYIQIVYNCFIKFLITDMHLPSLLNYVTDVITILLLILIYSNRGNKLPKIKIMPLILAGCLFMLNTISFVIDFTSPLLYIWGIRNVYRFFIFFYCCIYLLNVDDIYKIFELLKKILVINLFVCLFENFIMGIDFDFLGGLFGNGVEGGNGPLNALMIVVSTYVLIGFVNKQKRISEVLFIVGLSLIVSAIAELKIFFFELIIVFLLIVIFVKRNMKFMVLIVCMFVVGSFALGIYEKMYPTKSSFLSLNFIEEYAANTTYGSDTDINRLSAIKIIDERIFKNNLKKRMIGVGLGNAEMSSYPILTSKLYENYGNRIKYNWFSHAFAFVNGGYIGLTIYIMIFISILIKNVIKNHKLKNDMIQVSLICTALSIVFIFYNQTLRVESMGYCMFFIMSIPYIFDKKNEIT